MKSNTGEGRLEFKAAKGHSEYFHASFKRPQLIARRKVATRFHLAPGMHENLPEFFRELSKKWKGWDGKLEWNSLENDLILSCSHNKVGKISVEVRLVTDPYSSSHACSTIGVDPGQLESLAADAEKFFDTLKER